MIDLAITIACKAHQKQKRKSTGTPYISHIFSVAMMLSQARCSKQIIIAGILHDTVEDTHLTHIDIEKHFDKKIAKIVKECSENKKLSWEKRKEETITSLKKASLEACIVVCADKIHNLQSMHDEHKQQGTKMWESFSRGREKQEWYYRGMLKVLKQRKDAAKISLLKKFEKEVSILFG